MLLTRQAYKAFERKDFKTALALYIKLGNLVGFSLFEANINICLKRKEKSRTDSSDLNANTLVEAAEILAKIKMPLESAIRDRIALFKSHQGSANKSSRNIHTQQATEYLQSQEWEVIHMENYFEGDGYNLTKDGKTVPRESNNTFNIDSELTEEELTLTLFLKRIPAFRKRLRTLKPQIVVIPFDSAEALPVIVAAKQLSIPVIKGYLHYADIYKNILGRNERNGYNFGQKFPVELICNRLAAARYYHYPRQSNKFQTLAKLANRIRAQDPNTKVITTLGSKHPYEIKLYDCKPGLYYLEFEIIDNISANPKGALANFYALDERGESSRVPIVDLSSSKKFPQYRYLETSKKEGNYQVLPFYLEKQVDSLFIEIYANRTNKEVNLTHANAGKLNLEDVARWLSLEIPGTNWINKTLDFVNKEGAISLKLALLDHKCRITGDTRDEEKLNSSITEMIELDPNWLPLIPYRGKKVELNTNPKLTIAHLHKTAYPYENTGGAIRCMNTVLSQKRLDINSFVITPIGYPATVGNINSKSHENIAGINHFRIGPITEELGGLSLPERSIYSVFYIAKLLKEQGAQVIHAASGIRGYELAMQALALKKLTGLPVLYEVRSFHEHTWTKVRNDVVDLERTQLRSIKENACMAKADLVTTISESMKKVLVDRGIQAEKIEIVPNAIDENKYQDIDFSPANIPSLKGADLVVGYISNMSLREGHQYLIKSIALLRQKTGKDIRGLLVGDGSERSNLESLASNLGLAQSIVFTGEIDHKYINSYYMAIDIFVVPRIPDYAADWVTPLKPYEAMALQRPLIVSDLPALKEIVGINEERGLIAKPGDTESLAAQLQRYMDDSQLRQKKAKTARDWVFTERTWAKNAELYRDIYLRLVGKNVPKKGYFL